MSQLTISRKELFPGVQSSKLRIVIDDINSFEIENENEISLQLENGYHTIYIDYLSNNANKSLKFKDFKYIICNGRTIKYPSKIIKRNNNKVPKININIVEPRNPSLIVYKMKQLIIEKGNAKIIKDRESIPKEYLIPSFIISPKLLIEGNAFFILFASL